MVHSALIHFPIALLCTGAGVLGFALVFRRGDRRQKLVSGLAIPAFIAGALATVPTVVAGLVAAQGHEAHDISGHRLLGLATMVVSLFAVGSHLLRDRIKNADLIRNVLFVCAVGLVAATGFVGEKVAHGPGHSHASSSGPSDSASTTSKDNQ